MSCVLRHALTFAVILASLRAEATPPASNQLGLSTKRDRRAENAIALVFEPRRNFERVTVQAASGVASLEGKCPAGPLLAGSRHECRLVLRGIPAEPGMTINILATYDVAGSGPKPVEVHHVTLPNPAFDRSKFVPSASHHVVGPSSPPR